MRFQPNAAAERLALVEDISVLDVGAEVESLGAELLRGIPLPPKAALDALHIAIAVVKGGETSGSSTAASSAVSIGRLSRERAAVNANR